MFIDEAEIYVKAGNGGDGCVSFRHEKYIPNGGPNGGDGGKGGDVDFISDDQLHGLSEFARAKRFLAENGGNGMGKNMSGKKGDELVLKVPTGTQIYHKDKLLHDFVKPGERIVLLKGGNGGWGNQHFATSIKQAPEWAKEGMRGESLKIKLVLKTIADIGLVGLPNAGKSTLLSVLTKAKPKIADYPFTTLDPNLGILEYDGKRIVLADIPGLIEGASAGQGLGDKFLKHIERTRIILHLIDVSSADVISDYRSIRNELKLFSDELVCKKEIVVLSKIETVDETVVKKAIADFKKIKITPIAISAQIHQNIDKLLNAINKAV